MKPNAPGSIYVYVSDERATIQIIWFSYKNVVFKI